MKKPARTTKTIKRFPECYFSGVNNDFTSKCDDFLDIPVEVRGDFERWRKSFYAALRKTSIGWSPASSISSVKILCENKRGELLWFFVNTRALLEEMNLELLE